jgi:hypothetical protein
LQNDSCNPPPDTCLTSYHSHIQGITADEEADEAFCKAMYNNYLNDKEKDESYTLDECKREWGLIN